jgi:hypothetical protein
VNRAAFFKKIAESATRFGVSRLSQKSGVSRQALYEMFHTRNPRFDSLARVTKALGFSVDLIEENVPDNDVYASLQYYGAPVVCQATDDPMPLESTVAYGLSLARREQLAESLLPYVLHLNCEKLDLPRLVELAQRQNESRALGYFANVAFVYDNNPKLGLLKDLLKKENFTAEPLNKNVSPSKRMLKLYSLVSNDIAKQWGFLTQDDLEHLLQRYEKWEKDRMNANVR